LVGIEVSASALIVACYLPYMALKTVVDKVVFEIKSSARTCAREDPVTKHEMKKGKLLFSNWKAVRFLSGTVLAAYRTCSTDV